MVVFQKRLHGIFIINKREKKVMKKYEFKDGYVCASKLEKDELLKRMNRLNEIEIETIKFYLK